MNMNTAPSAAPAVPPAKIPIKQPCKIPAVAALCLATEKPSTRQSSSQPPCTPEHTTRPSLSNDAPHVSADRSSQTIDLASSREEDAREVHRSLSSSSITSTSSSSSSSITDSIDSSSDISSSLSSTTSSSLSSRLSRSSSRVSNFISDDAELAVGNELEPSESVPTKSATVLPVKTAQESIREVVTTANTQEEDLSNGPAVPPPRPHFFRTFPSDISKAIERFKDRLNREENTVRIKDDNKSVSLGTSKDNYIDPRIICSWAAQQNVPIKKIFSATRMKKFQWSLNEKNFKF